jgi:hypothetical protein
MYSYNYMYDVFKDKLMSVFEFDEHSVYLSLSQHCSHWLIDFRLFLALLHFIYQANVDVVHSKSTIIQTIGIFYFLAAIKLMNCSLVQRDVLKRIWHSFLTSSLALSRWPLNLWFVVHGMQWFATTSLLNIQATIL